MRPRWAVIALAGVLAWTVVVLFWASRPLTDHVPTGTHNEQGAYVANTPETSVAVTCPAPWSTGSAAGAVPTLPQDQNNDQYLKRDPCTEIHRQAQLLFIFDLVVSVVAVGLLGWMVVRPAPEDEPAPPVLVTASAGGV